MNENEWKAMQATKKWRGLYREERVRRIRWQLVAFAAAVAACYTTVLLLARFAA